ncbi:DNA gyrase, A subunit [Desulfosporosinus acidiphilus SJ4]|uniref:DNA topoisomerase (ATP-hydrolyzing) n=1 Tax=Desulfosporosinus acidiphilus (strain DSM 22704 / JCM 16185 / SJ4) TaxID=646529 RepID=I4D686_DESAJ|nr:DNA gyrase subunit A [Desulfosporosinus acidiphilus]AFM41310.1 DNA gyrase, A subunit [Desulfosporosinus acidiphilus SJ4]
MSMNEETISQRPLEEVLPESFLGYSKHVILQRAVPDVRDGLKPVHRRILYSMDEIGMSPDKPYSKSARLVGDCMGKYHPHGDSSIYESAVRMAQPWAIRYPLVDGQGNFGSIDGDNAAAMRYTEMRMTPLAQLMTQDLDKNTVLFKANYDQRLKEPVVLPSPFPNLLINGGSGIAVGMMSNIPPHNLKEVVAGLIQQIDHPDTTVEELLEKVKGPDFPTGGLIIGTDGIISAYKTGRGKVTMRGKAVIEQGKSGKNLIAITEIPFQVNKSTLASKIEAHADSGKISGISEVRDESDREGIRLVVECRKEADPLEVLRNLYKYTQMEETFGIINLVITPDGTPKVLGLKEINAAFIEHRKIVVTKRTKFELEKAKHRIHILEGLMIAINHLDEVIEIIRSSKTPALAKAALMTRFELSEIQSQAILDLKLQTLTNFELDGIRQDYDDTLRLISELEGILADVSKVFQIIKHELKDIADKYGDERRTRIMPEEMRNTFDLSSFEEVEHPFEVILTKQGYIKRIPLPSKNIKTMPALSFKDGDVVSLKVSATDQETLYFFTQTGNFYCIKAKTVPEAGPKEKGSPLSNLLQLQAEETIAAILSVKEGTDQSYFIFITQEGQVMRSPVKDFVHARNAEGMGLKENDVLTRVFIGTDAGELFIATYYGQAIRFPLTDINPMGRKARGMKGITLNEGDRVVDALLLMPENPLGDLVTLTERGYIKRTSFEEFKPQSRAGKGIAITKVSAEKIGYLTDITRANEEDSLEILQVEGDVTKIEIKSLKVESRAKSGSQWIPVLHNNFALGMF